IPGQHRRLRADRGAAPPRNARARLALHGHSYATGHGGDRHDRRLHRVSRPRGRWLADWVPLLRLLIFLVLPVTLVLGFCQSVAALTREHIDARPETSSEAVDALIEA